MHRKNIIKAVTLSILSLLIGCSLSPSSASLRTTPVNPSMEIPASSIPEVQRGPQVTDTPQKPAPPLTTPTYLPIVVNRPVFIPQGNEYFAAPNGSEAGDGSMNNPWDLHTALGKFKVVKPGDTIWLRGGRHGSGGGTIFNSLVKGTENKPVLIRQYPGEHAIVDGGIMAYGEWTWFWGFEITNSSLERDTEGINRPFGLDMVNRGQKAINLVIHNVGHPGIGFWEYVEDGGEIYGCLIWGVGLYDPKFLGNAPRGSGIYAQNEIGTRRIEEVITFRNFTTGMKAYAEEGFVNGFLLEGNVSFNNPDRNLFFSGEVNPVKNLQLINNFTYRDRKDAIDSVDIGYPKRDQQDAILQNNYFVSGTNSDGAFFSKYFRNLRFSGNVLVSPETFVNWLPAAEAGAVVWDDNTYFGGSRNPFKINGRSTSLQDWKERTSFDQNSRLNTDYPTGSWVFVRPNLYDRDRAHVVIYNWDLHDSVAVDLSSFLRPGDPYILLDAQNYFGKPVVEGTYVGSQVLVPMNLTEVSPIIGNVTHYRNEHTAPEFGVFILLRNSPAWQR